MSGDTTHPCRTALLKKKKKESHFCLLQFVASLGSYFKNYVKIQSK